MSSEKSIDYSRRLTFPLKTVPKTLMSWISIGFTTRGFLKDNIWPEGGWVSLLVKLTICHDYLFGGTLPYLSRRTRLASFPTLRLPILSAKPNTSAATDVTPVLRLQAGLVCNECGKKSMTRSAMYPVNHLGEPCRQAHATLDGWHWVFKLFHKALNLILYQNLFDSAVTRFTAAQTKLSGRAGAIVKSGGSGSDWIYSPAIFQNCWNLSAVLEARWHQPGAQVDTSELLSPRPSLPGGTFVYL